MERYGGIRPSLAWKLHVSCIVKLQASTRTLDGAMTTSNKRTIQTHGVSVMSVAAFTLQS